MSIAAYMELSIKEIIRHNIASGTALLIQGWPIWTGLICGPLIYFYVLKPLIRKGKK